MCLGMRAYWPEFALLLDLFCLDATSCHTPLGKCLPSNNLRFLVWFRTRQNVLKVPFSVADQWSILTHGIFYKCSSRSSRVVTCFCFLFVYWSCKYKVCLKRPRWVQMISPAHFSVSNSPLCVRASWTLIIFLHRRTKEEVVNAQGPSWFCSKKEF